MGNKDLEAWITQQRESNPNAFSVEELADHIGSDNSGRFAGMPHACETCKRWEETGVENTCSKGRKPRRYIMLDGPNEECHGIRFCPDYELYAGDQNEGAGIRHALDCNAQMYG